ncbi:zinc-dependent alcohol dehydrogenase family protein [Singulisphaera sp. PoT]|uniref:zinc-dependent alcohol dehydrogenase family protein n=1 Tax=Singulisphaera sp. PoT TaxID=3411797 RepID=UPI003BF55603
MRAMVLDAVGLLRDNPRPLRLAELADPIPGRGQILVRIKACGVCHTELDEIEGRMPPPRLPIVLGHQIVGRVVESGEDAHAFRVGDRVGIAWIHSSCGDCSYCTSGRENLCPEFRATGRDADGGYAELTTVPETFAYAIPEIFTDAEAAPLLCAGAIGYRSLRLTGIMHGQVLGLTGFGASAHLVLKLAHHLYPSTRIFVFARSEVERAFAREMGATWAGDTSEAPPAAMDAIIDTTPAWTPVLEALKHLAPGGRLVINAIRKEDQDKDVLLQLDYPTHLWREKEIKSVANVTRRDVAEFLRLAAEVPIRPVVQEYAMEDATQALLDLEQKVNRGAKVLVMK